MNVILGLIGIVFGCVLVKYREQVGNAVGEPAWALKVGGIYNVVIVLGILMAFWGLATMTGTTDVFLSPITSFLPGMRKSGVPEGF